MKKLNLNVIRIDGGTQSREHIYDEAVTDYADRLRAGDAFPAVVVFFDGADHWLADGFHRFHAHRAAERASIEADVRDGTRRDAILYSLGANDTHGLRRSSAEKRKAVETMLRDAEWANWSDSKIATICRVDHKTVAARRAAILGNSQDAPTVRTVERGGKTYQQDTSRIGKAERSPAPPAPAPSPTPAPKAPKSDRDLSNAEEAFGGFDPVAELEDAHKQLQDAERRIEALTKDDIAAELNKQIGIRQGIEARLSVEMEKVGQLQKELDAYGRWFAELRKVTGLERRSDITRFVREAANDKSEAL